MEQILCRISGTIAACTPERSPDSPGCAKSGRLDQPDETGTDGYDFTYGFRLRY
ncbi:MAG TPA: hypothetical protein VKJ00_08580 [Thermoanaerobaculia bacterium]|nr:hypothetical protein [Thermoanaerobaculia bacterium]